MSTSLSKLPATAAEWHKEVADADVEDLSIFDLHAYDSGSNITNIQFLLLRVLWLKEDQNVFSRTAQSWISQHEYEKAKRLLKANRYWQLYLESFKQTAAELSGKPLPDLGTFSLVRDCQCAVETIENDDSSESLKFSPIAHRTRGRAALMTSLQAPSTPTPIRTVADRPQPDPYLTPVMHKITDKMKDLTKGFGASGSLESSAAMKSDILSPYSPIGLEAATWFPPAKDEEIVNSALVLFLKAVTVHFVGNADWSFQRKAFHVAEKGEKRFEARVDGVLIRRSDHRIMAILEAKPFVRGKGEAAIQQQEAAEMAASISSEDEASAEAGVPMT
jgi:hypothetical protein